MKQFVTVAVVCFVLTGCGTVGGAVSGAGQDLSRAGEWIKSK
jgi:predicted small secreted protein